MNKSARLDCASHVVADQTICADDRGDLHSYAWPTHVVDHVIWSGREKDQKVEIGGSIKVFGQEDRGNVADRRRIAKRKGSSLCAVRAAGGFVYNVAERMERASPPNQTIARSPFVRIDTNILDRITIDAPGKGKMVSHVKVRWTIASSKNTPANSGEVRRFIDTLQNEQVTRFVETSLPICRIRLDKPQLQLTPVHSLRRTPPRLELASRLLPTIAFGKVDGDKVYARLADEPLSWRSVAHYRSNFHRSVPWQELSIFTFKPRIHRLSVATKYEVHLRGTQKGNGIG